MFGKLENENFLETASDNIYFRFHSNHILKAGGGFLVVFQNSLATMIKCRNACQSNCVSPDIGSISLDYVNWYNTK